MSVDQIEKGWPWKALAAELGIEVERLEQATLACDMAIVPMPFATYMALAADAAVRAGFPRYEDVRKPDWPEGSS